MNLSRGRLVLLALLATLLLLASPLSLLNADAEGSISVTASPEDSGVVDLTRDGVAEIAGYGRTYRSLSLGEQSGHGRDLRYVAPVTPNAEQRERIAAGAPARFRFVILGANDVDDRKIGVTALPGGLSGTDDYNRTGVPVKTIAVKAGVVELDVTAAMRAIKDPTVTFRLHLSRIGDIDLRLTKVDIATVESNNSSFRPSLIVGDAPQAATTTTTAAPTPTSATPTTAPKATTTTSTTAKPSDPPPPPPPGSNGFAHPGVLLDRGQLDFVKAKIAAGAEPWKSALDRVMSHGSSTKTNSPRQHLQVLVAVVPRGAGVGDPCTQRQRPEVARRPSRVLPAGRR